MKLTKVVKRVICLISVLAVCFAFAGCGSKEAEVDAVQQDLIKYVEQDLPTIKGDEATAVERYNYVATNISSMSRADILATFNDEIIPCYTNFYNNLSAIAPSEPLVIGLHNDYVAAVKLQLDGVTALAQAIAENNSEAATAANDMITQGKTGIEKHRQDIITLAGEHNIDISVGAVSAPAAEEATEATE